MDDNKDRPLTHEELVQEVIAKVLKMNKKQLEEFREKAKLNKD